MITPDSAMAWVVLAACIFNSAVGLAVSMGCGVYVAAMIEYYGSSRAEGYVVASLSNGLMFAIGPVVSFVIHRTSYRVSAMSGGVLSCVGVVLSANVPNLYWQYFTVSLTACGCGFMYLTAITTVAFYFKKYRGIAMGLTMAGAGLGVLVYPIMCLALIDIYTWQPSLYIVAGLCLNTCVSSSLIRPLRIESDNDGMKGANEITSHNHTNGMKSTTLIHTDEQVNGFHSNIKFIEQRTNIDVDLLKQTTPVDPQDDGKNVGITDEICVSLVTNEISHGRNTSVWCSRSFVFYIGNMILFYGPCIVPFVLMPDMYRKRNIPHYEQNILYLALGITGIFGRIAAGAVVNMNIGSAIRVYCILNLIWGFVLLLFIFDANFYILILANVGYGFSYGGFIAIYSLVILDIVGLDNLNKAIGIVGLVAGSSGSIAVPLLGVIYDATQSYTWLLVVSAIMAVLAAMFMVPPAFIWTNKRTDIQR